MTTNGKPTLRVLLIEDNQDDVSLIVRVLQKEFHAIWHRVETEAALVLSMQEPSWDVVLCDYRLPQFTAERALEVVQEQCLRLRCETPFIVISGVVDETVAISLLKKGARDFIAKDKLQRLPLAIRREIRQGGELLRARIVVGENQDAIIEAWGNALELRDKYTKGHTERVTNLALRLALELGVSHQEFVNINRGSLLHDIGKMGIPDAILLKRDVLTLDEMETMKMHPKLAYEMLKDIPFLRAAVDIPYCHHERWNGTGYPQGLLGATIPFSARLFAVVDVYDALTSDRPYRQSWEKARAIDYILGERNVTFDPEIVDAFVNMVGRG